MRAICMILLVACLSAACAVDVGAPPVERTESTSVALDAVASFGPNPGKLLMFRYAPAAMPQNAPLVVLLHGCTQTAADFANAGWNALADKYKFYVAYAQQQSANNPSTCFDWFGTYNVPSDKTNLTRGKGENESIKEMVDKMKADFSVDASRVFVVGFSAGAAMAAVMLATWPDVFAGGGIGEGIPYNCPSTQNVDVFQCMNPGKTMAASSWGTLVKNAYTGFSGSWPRVSIWEGTQDTTVATANQAQLVAQWTNVHGIAGTPTTTDTVNGHAHAVYADGNGHARVETYSVSGMAHGFAIDKANGCGTASTYTPDAKICEALQMVKFFGIDSPAADGGASGGGDSGAAHDGGVAHGGDGGCAGSCGGGGGSGGGADSGAPGACATCGGGGNADDSFAPAQRGGGCAVSRSPLERDDDGLVAIMGMTGLALLARAHARASRRSRRHAS